MFVKFRRPQRCHFVQVIFIGLMLSGIMLYWDKLNSFSFDYLSVNPYHFLGMGQSFRNSSFTVSRAEARKFSNYHYLINHKNTCESSNVLLLLFVKSFPQNFARRQSIRLTWGNERYIDSELGVSVKVLFALGVHPHLKDRALIQSQLFREDQMYHDLIQQSFIDSFYNLTTKLLLQINWAHTYCSHAHFLMSADDDMLIHMPNLVTYLKQVHQAGTRDFWVGRVFNNTGPVRIKSSKYYVSPHLYPWDSYPAYTGGAGYVVSRDVASRIHKASLTLNATLHIDDVFMGICASVIGVAPKAHNFFSGEKKSPHHPCIYKQMMTSHGHESDLQEVWGQATNPEVQKVDSGFTGKLYCSVIKCALLCNPFIRNTYPCNPSTIF
ncbi:lactosylceramide 1,3-N-acetyl-beta-D-glucosaminyltransferase B [Alosa pseudoharengus]|uniref:lactosylceramide 1,3-N-acetyl-beta-D-glucosaminyltransferase B n=1 Tax=Alosa pseudoharengus TaxID=34774 RepID=UPI003F8C1269